MWAAYPGSCPQHPLAGGRTRRHVKSGGKNARTNCHVFCRRRCRGACSAERPCGRQLAEPADPHRRALPRRRHCRHRCPRGDRTSRSRFEAGDRGGSPPRRQQQYRHGCGRTQRGRRLHLACHGTCRAGQPKPLQGCRLGSAEGFQMRGPRGVEPERRARAAVVSGQDNRRVRGARPRKAGSAQFRNPGTGSSIDLSAQKLFQAADIKLTNVSYKGQPPALLDLMTGLIHFEIVSLALALPHIKEGTVKPLAVFTEQRVADLPDVPTITEAGFAQAAYVPWYGIYVPSATPDALVEKIHDAIDKALGNPDVQRQLAISDIPGKPMPLSDLTVLMKADYEKLNKVVKTSGMALQ